MYEVKVVELVYSLFSNTPPQTRDNEKQASMVSYGCHVSGFVSPLASILAVGTCVILNVPSSTCSHMKWKWVLMCQLQPWKWASLAMVMLAVLSKKSSVVGGSPPLNMLISCIRQHSHSVLRSFFLIVLFYSLLILVVYSLGEVDVIPTSTPLIFSFIPCLPFVSLIFLWTQLTPKLSLSQQLIFPAFHEVLYGSFSFLIDASLGPCTHFSYLNTWLVTLDRHSQSSQYQQA